MSSLLLQMRLRPLNRENPVGKMNADATQVTRSALHEIGNKVSNITLDVKKKDDLTQKVSVRQKAIVAAAQKAATIVNPLADTVVKQVRIPIFFFFFF